MCPAPFLDDATSMTPLLHASAVGSYSLQLRASRGCFEYRDAMTVHIKCLHPLPAMAVVASINGQAISNGDSAATVAVPTTNEFPAISLACVERAPETPQPQSNPVAYRWAILEAPAVALTEGARAVAPAPLRVDGETRPNATAVFTPPALGTYTVGVVATGGCGTTASANVTLQVQCKSRLAAVAVTRLHHSQPGSSVLESAPGLRSWDTVTFRAVPHDANGNSISGVPLQWDMVRIPIGSLVLRHATQTARSLPSDGASVVRWWSSNGDAFLRADTAGEYSVRVTARDTCTAASAVVDTLVACVRLGAVDVNPHIRVQAGIALMAERVSGVSPVVVPLVATVKRLDGTSTVVGARGWWSLVSRPGDSLAASGLSDDCHESDAGYGSSFFVNERLHCRRSTSGVHNASHLDRAWFSPDRTGTFVFVATAVDECSPTGNRTATVTVTVACNHPPVANAGVLLIDFTRALAYHACASYVLVVIARCAAVCCSGNDSVLGRQR